MDDHGVSGTVLGHRDFISTSCPGDRAYALVKDGTFTAPPGAIPVGSDPLIGLKKGDSGEAVKAVQALVHAAGFADVAGAVDGDYGAKTAEGVRLVRAYVGSKALEGYGDEITGWGYAQLYEAVAKRTAERAGGGGTVGAHMDLVVDSLTAKSVVTDRLVAGEP
jgi:peptidoglycan hydrolase-like protein with peptidoglycan-binding domain